MFMAQGSATGALRRLGKVEAAYFSEAVGREPTAVRTVNFPPCDSHWTHFKTFHSSARRRRFAVWCYV